MCKYVTYVTIYLTHVIVKQDNFFKKIWTIILKGYCLIILSISITLKHQKTLIIKTITFKILNGNGYYRQNLYHNYNL